MKFLPKRQRSLRSLWLIAALLLPAVFFSTQLLTPLSAQAAQTIPYKVNFQGRLTDQNGNILANGTYNIKFRLFDAVTSGNNKWEEDRLAGTPDTRITVTNGLFNVQFGDVTALSTALFSGVYPLYLEIELPTPATATCATASCASFTEGAMTPRQPLASSPYAFNADSVGGIASTSLVVLSPSSAQSGTINVSGAITSGASLTAPAAILTGTSALTLGSTTGVGSILFQDGTASSNKLTLSVAALSAAFSLTLPTTAPTANQCLQAGATTAALLTFSSCSSGGSGFINNSITSQTANFNITGTGVAAILQSGTFDTAVSQVLSIGTTNATSVSINQSTVIPNGKLQIGSATTDTTQVNLQLDSYSVFADSGTCSTTTNQGALYYSTATNAIRSCINGSWEDIVTTGGLGILAFGVIPDSVNAGAPGDVGGVSGNTNSPCKVTWTSATSVTVNPCLAYSGGRKVVIPSTVLSTSTVTASAFTNVCLSGTGNQPVLLTANTTETSAGVPTFSAGNPVVCLATVKMTTTTGTVGNIWDTRTFTNTVKEFITLNAVNSPGYVAIGTATNNTATVTATAASGPIRGVIIATTGTASTTVVDAIIAVNGLQYTKIPASGTATVNALAQTAGINGYVQTATFATTATNYAWMGSLIRGVDTTCTSAATCQFSGLIDLNISR